MLKSWVDDFKQRAYELPPVGCEVKLSQVFLLHIVQQVARQCVRWPFSLQLEEDADSVEVEVVLGQTLKMTMPASWPAAKRLSEGWPAITQNLSFSLLR